ncbi:hypothetical protein BLS_001127, partial [Venturia inaequalis]
ENRDEGSRANPRDNTRWEAPRSYPNDNARWEPPRYPTGGRGYPTNDARWEPPRDNTRGDPRYPTDSRDRRYSDLAYNSNEEPEKSNRFNPDYVGFFDPNLYSHDAVEERSSKYFYRMVEPFIEALQDARSSTMDEFIRAIELRRFDFQDFDRARNQSGQSGGGFKDAASNPDNRRLGDQDWNKFKSRESSRDRDRRDQSRDRRLVGFSESRQRSSDGRNDRKDNKGNNSGGVYHVVFNNVSEDAGRGYRATSRDSRSPIVNYFLEANLVPPPLQLTHSADSPDLVNLKPRKPNPPKPSKCKVCAREFLSTNKLWAHLRDSHDFSTKNRASEDVVAIHYLDAEDTREALPVIPALTRGKLRSFASTRDAKADPSVIAETIKPQTLRGIAGTASTTLKATIRRPRFEEVRVLSNETTIVRRGEATLVPIKIPSKLPLGKDFEFRSHASDSLRNFHVGRGRLYNQVIDEYFIHVIVRNDGDFDLIVPRGASLGILSECDYEGCYNLSTDNYHLATLPVVEDASLETKLDNSVTIFGKPEVVRRIAEVVHEFPKLWANKNTVIKIPEEDWATIPILDEFK